MLFQFLGRGLAQYGGTPYFLPDSKSSLSGFSNEVLFVSEFILEGAKTCLGQCIFLNLFQAMIDAHLF